jgi:hypothetical protein
MNSIVRGMEKAALMDQYRSGGPTLHKAGAVDREINTGAAKNERDYSR